MSAHSNSGGPAFPVPRYVNAYGETFDSRIQGMTLRDYFAAHAPAQIPDGASDTSWFSMSSGVERPIAPPSDAHTWSYFWIACEAILRYRYADAMLQAREAKR